MALKPTLFLDVGGRSFEGWKRVRVQRSVDNACTQFGLVATRSWPGQEEQWWIEPGDKCQVRVNDQIVCTGWVDAMGPSYDADSHTIEISGRGLVCDLVDCSYFGPPWQWKNVDPGDVIRAICAQFSIPVAFAAPLGEPFDFVIQQGEAGWEAIDRICRLRQVLAYDQPDGSLLITRGSEEVCPTPLRQGDNILEATGALDDRERYSRYVVKGQQPGKDVSPEQAAQSLGEVVDPSIRRNRPLILVSSADTDNGTALERAKWEKQQRWGKARTATITVPGWLQPDREELWPINRLCDVIDDWLGLDRRLAITGSIIDASGSGLRTILTLQPPEALTPAPPDAPVAGAKPKGEGGSGFWEQVAADRQAGEARRRETKQ